MSTLRVRVRRKRLEALDIASFELVDADGGALPPFSAGAHVDVHVPGGLIRQYSLCNDVRERSHYRIAVLKDPRSRGGSQSMHDVVTEDSVLAIGSPRNNFPLVPARKSLLFAGGIGVTPLLSMARHLDATGMDFELHYCARSASRTAFLDEIATAPFAKRVHIHHDDGPAEQMLDARTALGQPAGDIHAYICGPQGFIEHLTSAARSQGWPEEQVHLEYFGVEPVKTGGDLCFQICLASSGQCYEVPSGVTVVQALQAHGVVIPISCEQGVCGTCVTRVLSGECDHRDMYFTDEEKARNDQFTPCCSRARSPTLVLDL